MPDSCRLPINCAVTGVSYVVQFQLGSAAIPLSLIVDTGSSMTAVDGASYNPSNDSAATTGDLLQNAAYLSGNFLGAVVQSPIAIRPSAGTPVTFPSADLAISYAGAANSFDGAHGILGLGFKSGNPAYTMPGNTWQNKYPANQLPGAPNVLLDPLLDRLAGAGLVDCAFAFGVRRSLRSQATGNPATDPANSGILVLGGGSDCTDLYQGTPAYAKVIAADKYNTSLSSIQVGTQPPIPVSAPPSWSNAKSNSFIDSGAPSLMLDQTLYNSVLAAFRATNSSFADALSEYAIGMNAGCDQTMIDLGAWPPLTLILEGDAGTNVTISVAAGDYWQFDAAGKGQAVAALCGDQGTMGGESVLGLPLFAGNFVLFDRTAAPGGPGRIGFAPLR